MGEEHVRVPVMEEHELTSTVVMFSRGIRAQSSNNHGIDG